jgi:peroxiredoxin
MRRGVFVCSCVLAAMFAALGYRVQAAAPYTLLGQSAPDFALRAIVGDNVRLSEYRGEVVIVTFWSSRCAPCSRELSALHRSLRTYGAAGLKVFGVSVDDDQMRAREYAVAHPVHFPLLLDPGKEVSRRYRVDSLPMTVLIDRAGAIRHMHRDYGGQSEARQLHELRTLLNE